MKPLIALSIPTIIIASTLSVSSIFSKTTNNTSHVVLKQTPTVTIYELDYSRIKRMGFLLENFSKENYEEYKQLCKEAIFPPKIGMTFEQSRNSTWCFPYSRNKTTTKYGEYVQETYLKNDSELAPKKYLYFENGILTSIQE